MRQTVRPVERTCTVIGKNGPTGLAALLVIAVSTLAIANRSLAQESSEVSMAAYADAANFQTGGAIELAIEGWNEFLDQYPDDPMVPMAAHYLGVCHMQKESPDLLAASQAFARALQKKDYELREESLANQGWCLYASAGEGQQRDKKRLQQALATYATLRKESPKSQYLGRALFYSGEASYGLGRAEEAIDFYDQFLAMPGVKESPLRCDAYYARGVAHEDLKQYDKAIASYKQLLGSCDGRGELITDVHIRMGDLGILRKQFSAAVASFAAAFDSTDSPEDRSYALFREAYALVQANQPRDAAGKYEQLLGEFPESPYAAQATLASAQSSYRSGDMEQAAKRFRRVLSQKNAAAATEAAHWLARIEISAGNLAEAEKLCRRQIDAGIEGEYAMSLRLDLAEALSMNPDKVKESMVLFEQAYRDRPRDPLAPRALYNAAFSALQTNQPETALKLAGEFLNKFPKDTLLPDIRFVAAEAQLQTGKAGDAADTYKRLLASSSKDNVQRPLWVLRAAAACNSARKYDDSIAIVRRDLALLKQPSQKAEAQFLLGQAQMMAGRPAEAAKAFQASRNADRSWARADEAFLMAGQAMLAAGNQRAAIDTWQRLINESPRTRMADQARYKLAQRANASGDFDQAVRHYDEILRSKKDPALMPYVLYGKGWSLIQVEKYNEAFQTLDQMLKENRQHPARNDATLARGITLRNLDRLDEARIDLETYLTIPPKGTNLGHTLYELALIDQKQKQPAKAAARLERLVQEVPDYPSMDKVLYELGWSHREAGNDDAAVKQFAILINRYGTTPLAAEAAYYVGQKRYVQDDWKGAAKNFQTAAQYTDDSELSEKALYRLGWSHFKSQDYDSASAAFQQQAEKHSAGQLSLDAMMMVGECQFKQAKYKEALAAYDAARQRIRQTNDSANTIRDPEERQVRELILLHGGQSASQLKQWKNAIDWLTELRERFPATKYLPETFYETGFSYQQAGDTDNALKFFAEVANNYRIEVAARARFMMGEIYFGERQFDKAIPQFQRVMFGFGADKAPASIKNWQAKSGFEAGRCSELLMQQAKTKPSQEKALKIAMDFFAYVIDKHPQHELAAKSRQRLEALKRQ